MPLQDKEIDTAGVKVEDGTYAYAALEDGAKQDCCKCKEAIKKWQAASANFNGLPPAQAADDNIYTNTDNMSFVAMYNTGSSPTADCRFATCKDPASSKEGYAVVCLTTPATLKKSAPFT